MLGRSWVVPDDSPLRGLVDSLCFEWRDFLAVFDLLCLGLSAGESIDPMLSVDDCRLEPFGKAGKSGPFLGDESAKPVNE